MSRAFRVAVVNSHPIQYFAPLYAYLNRDPVLAVTALYCSDFSLRGAIDPGFKQAQQKAEDMTAPTIHRSTSKNPLTRRRRPDMTAHIIARGRRGIEVGAG